LVGEDSIHKNKKQKKGLQSKEAKASNEQIDPHK